MRIIIPLFQDFSFSTVKKAHLDKIIGVQIALDIYKIYILTSMAKQIIYLPT